jgi:hypothetical protein
MSSSATTVPVPVVIWSKGSKRIAECNVTMHTTFEEMIGQLQVEGVQAALVGRSAGMPFRLFAGDWEPDVMSGAPPTKADTFKHELVIIVGWMHYLEEPYCDTIQAKSDIEEIYKQEHMLPACLAHHTVHLFTYNHQDVDCCKGENGPWTERNPRATTAADSLWLRLEQEFLLRNNRFYERLGETDWGHATLGTASALVRSDTTVTNPATRMVEMRGMVEAL